MTGLSPRPLDAACRFEMRRTEAHEAIAVASRALREQHNRHSCANRFADLSIDERNAGTTTTIDVNDAWMATICFPNG
jgi:hypothetical protein